MKRKRIEHETSGCIGYEISVSDFEHTADVHSDAGGWGFTWTCPDCYEKLTWAPTKWWRIECCRIWNVNINITGIDRKMYWDAYTVIDFQI